MGELVSRQGSEGEGTGRLEESESPLETASVLPQSPGYPRRISSGGCLDVSP